MSRTLGRAMSRLRCRLRTVLGTVTMAVFWRSLLNGPLVVFSGHVWPYPPVWGKPELTDEGWIERDESCCEDCGWREEPLPWRRSWRTP